MARRRTNKRQHHGEDVLSEVESVDVRLENQKVYRFRPEDETKIPNDYQELLREAENAPQRLAFWSLQTERALARVRRMECELEREEAAYSFNVRDNLDRNTGAKYVSDQMVRHGMTYIEEVQKVRDELEDARETYGLIRAIRDTVSARNSTIRSLLQARDRS